MAHGNIGHAFGKYAIDDPSIELSGTASIAQVASYLVSHSLT